MVNFVLQIRVFTRGDGSIVPVPHVGHGVRAPTESNVGGWGGVAVHFQLFGWTKRDMEIHPRG